jgi:hypothetical protein
MAVRYLARVRRLERTIARIETARRSIAELEQSHAERDAWWRQHADTLVSWKSEIEIRQRREPSSAATAAAERFRDWARIRRRLHPAVLRLRLECWWLSMRAAFRRPGRRR